VCSMVDCSPDNIVTIVVCVFNGRLTVTSARCVFNGR